ncbi:hypothetical protein [Roseibium sp. M-1]
MDHKHGNSAKGSRSAAIAAPEIQPDTPADAKSGYGREKWSGQKGPNPLLLMGLDRS